MAKKNNWCMATEEREINHYEQDVEEKLGTSVRQAVG